MNAIHDAERQTLRLVDIIDLKWLLAHEGVHVHVERLQREPAYLQALLRIAAASGNDALRAAGQRLGNAMPPAQG